MSSPDTLVSGVAGALDELVAALQAAGVDATRNPEELQPPAAIVAVPSFIGGTMGALTVTIPVYFVSPDVGQRSGRRYAWQCSRSDSRCYGLGKRAPPYGSPHSTHRDSRACL